MSSQINPDFQAKLLPIKLLVLDVDGTLTDGGLYYNDRGEEMKKFNVKDGQGLKLLMNSGVDVAIISASTAKSTLFRAKKLGIQHVFIGEEDKIARLRSLCETLSINLPQVGYVGDDVNDLPVMKEVGCPMTVANAVDSAKEAACYITERDGGDGAVREICDLIISGQMSQQ